MSGWGRELCRVEIRFLHVCPQRKHGGSSDCRRAEHEENVPHNGARRDTGRVSKPHVLRLSTCSRGRQGVSDCLHGAHPLTSLFGNHTGARIQGQVCVLRARAARETPLRPHPARIRRDPGRHPRCSIFQHKPPHVQACDKRRRVQRTGGWERSARRMGGSTLEGGRLQASVSRSQDRRDGGDVPQQIPYSAL